MIRLSSFQFSLHLVRRLPDSLDLFLREYKLLVKLHARLVGVPAKDTGSGSGQIPQLGAFKGSVGPCQLNMSDGVTV
jgi:hypothetical protein